MLKPRGAPASGVSRGIRAERARRDLAEFSRQAWPVLEPGTPLEWNWHLDAICAHAQAALEDWRAVMLTRAENAVLPGSARSALPLQRIRNLILNVPPGTGKSRFISVFTPAWMWTGSPQWRAIFVSGNPKVALRDARYCRQLIESEWYQESFIAPLAEGMRWRIKPDQRAAGWFGNTRGGQRLAFGTGASITGDRADALFVDDPNDAAEVESHALREAVNEWWDLGTSNRVSDLRHSVRIAIMQRLHEDDWTGHVEQRTGEWAKVAIAQEFEPGVIALPSPIGWTDPRESPGELMFPGRFPAETLQGGAGAAGRAGICGAASAASGSRERHRVSGGVVFGTVYTVSSDIRSVELLGYGDKSVGGERRDGLCDGGSGRGRQLLCAADVAWAGGDAGNREEVDCAGVGVSGGVRGSLPGGLCGGQGERLDADAVCEAGSARAGGDSS